MNNHINQLKELQQKLNTISDRATRLENKLDYMSSVLERMNTQLKALTERT